MGKLSQDDSKPLTIISSPTPCLSSSQRPRAEACERLTISTLRPLVERNATSTTLEDGTLLQLAWSSVKSCYGGTGLALLILCPGCSRRCRVLHCPPGRGWGCWKCTPISTPSHRRSGSRRGRPKPETWHIDRHKEEEARVLRLLGLERRVGEDRSAWMLLWASRRVNPGMGRKRRQALVDRALAHRNLAQVTGLLYLRRDLIVLGATLAPVPDLLSAVVAMAEETISRTSWAMRRPARDVRTGRDRPRRQRLSGFRAPERPRRLPPWLSTC